MPHESGLAQGVSSARLVWTRTLRLFSILQQAPGFSGESQSSAGLDVHHALVIYCLKSTMQSLTGVGSVLRTLQI